MRAIQLIAARELGAYFATPVATVFIVIFLILQGAMTFNLGNFFDRGQADLAPFFTFLPWVFLLLVPAITMRLWAEERRQGTIELLLTLPITQGQAVIGKFLAAWAFCGVALALTFPFVLTVNLLAVGAAMSAATRNQVIAFVLAVAVCFVFAVASYPLVTDFLSRNTPILAEVARRLAILDRYQAFTRGIVSLRDAVFFASFIGFWLFLNTVLVDQRKTD